MTILLKQVLIADPSSAFNGQTKDILISNGKITQIDDSISGGDSVVEGKSLVVTPGWVDVFAAFGDPGFEFRETVETGAAAAAAGGYADVCVLPNTNPFTDTKTQVEYLVRKSQSTAINVLPLGAITKKGEGKELAEMYDMFSSGAIAFTDGTNPVQSAGLMVKALQYVKPFNGVIIQIPIDKSIGQYGLIHEGVVSTQMGLPGIPAIAEELMVARDIKLARYAESKLHFTGITSAKSLEYIQRAKEGGIQVSCSVTPYHLYFCDEDMRDYDTNLKVNPPLRSKADMLALREGVKNGVIDMIATHHMPYEWDSKVCEFEYAKNGMTGLETAFAVVNSAIPGLSAEAIAKIFATNARQLLQIKADSIDVNNECALTIYSKENTTNITASTSKSKSKNSPFLGKSLQGKVIATITKGNLNLNS